MYDVKSNFSNVFKDEDMICRICKKPDSYEDEMHTFQCDELTSDIDIKTNIKFTDIFGNISKQTAAIKYFLQIIKRRELILKIRKFTRS